ncbi:MAG: tetratricopeptide repeat protein [Deltaproteobacteria bacterium]|nr:tetratricopeptide repeat protein [Deltaproteobacteria bacterium]
MSAALANNLREALGHLRRNPANDEALSRCESLLRDRGRFGDLVRLYEELALVLPPDEAARMLVKAGRLWREHLGNREGSRLAFLKSLKFRETIEALDALIDMALESRNWWGAAGFMEKRAELLDEPVEKAEAFIKAAELYKDRLRRNRESAFLYRKAFLVAPARVDIFENEIAIRSSRGTWAEVTRTLEMLEDVQPEAEVLSKAYLLAGEALSEAPLQSERALDCLDRLRELGVEAERAEELKAKIEADRQDSKKRIRALREAALNAHNKLEASSLYLKVADLYIVAESDKERAVENVERALLLHPGHMEAIYFLERLYSEGEKFKELVEFLEKAAAGLLDEEDRVDVHLKLALLCTTYLENPEKAIEHYKAVLKADPSNQEAVDSLREYFQAKGDINSAVGFLLKAAENSGLSAQRVSFFKQAAELQHDAEDLDGAGKSYERILEDDPFNEEAMDSLVEIYRALSLNRELASILGRIADINTGQARKEKLLEWARVLEADLEDPLGAFDALSRTIIEFPDDNGFRKELGRLAEKTGKLKELARLYEESLAGSPKNEDWMSLMFELADLYKGRIEDYRKAEECYRRIIEVEPADHRAFASLKALYEMGGRWANLVELLSQRAEMFEETHPDEAVSLWKESCEVYREHLRSPEKAIATARRILQLAPDDGETEEHLLSLLVSERKWKEYTDYLMAKAEAAEETADKIAIYKQILHVLETNGGDYQVAAEIAGRIVEVAPEDYEAVKKFAGFLKHLGRWEEYASALQRVLQICRSEPDKCEPAIIRDLNLELASVLEWQLERPDSAAQEYASIVREDPSCEQAVQALERLIDIESAAPYASEVLEPVFEKNEDWPKLVKVLKVKLKGISGRARSKLQKRISKIAEEKLERVDEAFDGYAAAFEGDPDSNTAKEELERVAAETGRWSELADIFIRTENELDDSAKAAGLKLDAAKILVHRLGKLDQAASIYKELYTADPNNQEVFDDLAELYRRLDIPGDLAALLVGHAGRVEDPERAADYLREAADLFEEKLDDLASAADALKGIIEIRPGDKEILARLARLYERDQDWHGLESVLKALADQAGEDSERTAMEIMLGQLQAGPLSSGEEAVVTFSGILERDPENEDALAGLEEFLEDDALKVDASKVLVPIYRHNKEWARAIEAMEILCEAEADKGRRKEILDEIARIYGEELKRRDMQIVTLLRILKEIPQDNELRMRIESIASDLDAWEEVVAAYEDLLEGSQGELWVQLRLALARIYSEGLENNERALEQLRALSAADPAREDVRIAEIDLLRKLGKFEDLAEVLEVEAGRAADSGNTDRQKELLLELGAIARERLGDVHRAIEAYETLAALDKSDRAVALTRISLYREAGRWEDLVSALREQAESTGDVDMAVAHRLDLAEVLERELSRPNEAITVYARLLQSDDQPPEAVKALERLLSGETTRKAAAEVLAPYYERVKDWRRRIETLEVIIEEEKETETRKRLLLEIASLYEQQLESPALAFVTLCRPFRENPNDVDLEEHLASLAREAGQEEELAAVLDEILGLQDLETSRKVELGLKLAALQNEKLGDSSAALGTYKAILKWEPSNADAIAGLAELSEQGGNWQEVVTALEMKIQSEEEPVEKARLFLKLGDTRREKLEDPQGALSAYESARECKPDDIDIMDRMIDLYEDLERWRDLAVLLPERIAKSSGDERVELELSLARVLEEELEDYEGAVDVYTSILDRHPGNEEAIEALDDIMKVEGVDAEKVADVLDPIFLARKDWGKLLGNYEVRLSKSRDPAARLDWYKAMAGICEKEMEQPAAAFYILSRAYGEGFDDRKVELELYRLAESTGKLEELARELAMSAEEAQDPVKKSGLYWKLGRLHKNRLGDQEQAVTYYEMAADLVPNDKRILTELAGIYEELETWSKWVEVQKKRIEQKEKELAERAEHEAQVEGDADSSTIPVEVDESEIESVEEEPRQGRDEEEVEEESEESEEETLENLYLDTASVLREELGDIDAAIALLESAKSKGVATEAIEGDLVDLYIENGSWEALTTTLEERIAHQEKGPGLSSMLLNLARIYKTKLGEPDRGLDLLAEAIDADPENREALEEMTSFLEDEDRKDKAAGVLVEHAERLEAWDVLSRALEVAVDMAHDKDQGDLLRKAAWVHEKKLNEPEVAFAYLSRAFRLSPLMQDVLEEIERLVEVTNSYEAAAGLFEEMAERLEFSDRAAAVDLFARAAGIYMEKLDLPDLAASCYRQVLDVDPEHAEALRGLVKVCKAREAWDDLADALSRAIAVTGAGPELAELVFELGEVYEKHLDDLQRARENYEQVLSMDAAHRGALEALERVYEDFEEWGPLFEIYEKARELASSEEAKIEFTAKMADLAGEELGMRERAIELWNELLVADPEDPDALEALEELYTATERWQDLVEIYRKQLESTVEDEEKIRLFTKLGYLRSEKIKELDQAKTDWICVLRLEPNNMTALAMLMEVYEEKEEWEDLAAILKRLCSLQKNDEVKKSLYLKLALVYGDKLGRRQDAIAAGKEVLELDPLTEEELDKLAGIFLDNEAWEEASGVLERRWELAEDELEQVEVRRNIAEMWRDRAMDAGRAALEYEKILKAVPSNEQAFKALDEILRTRREWKKLATAFESRGQALVESGADIGEIVEHYSDLADIYEKKLDDPVKALAAWRRVLEVAPDSGDARVEVERLAAETGGFGELVESLASLIEEADTPSAAIGLRLTRARVLKDELDDLDQAEEEFKAILEIAPENKEALDSLAALLKKKKEFGDLSEILERRAHCEEGQARAAFLLEAAKVSEENLDDMERATKLRKEVLRLGGEASEEALEELRRSLSQTEEFEELASVLEDAVSRSDSKIDTRNSLEELARIYEKKLKQADKAIEKLEIVTKEHPRYRPAWKALERLYHKEGKWRELIEVYNKLVTLAEEDGERVELYANAAAIWEEEFGERVMAIESLKKILALDPANIGAVTSLERLYRQGEEWARLIEIHHKHIALSDDTSKIVELYNKIGEVYEHDLDRPDRAVDAYSQAVNFDPRNKDALSALARLYEKSGRWERAIEMLERYAGAVEDPEEKTELIFRAGRIFEVELSDSKRAKARYKQALDGSPGHLPSLRALKNLASSEGDWEAYLPLLIQEEKCTEGSADKAKLLVEIGRFYMERRKDPAAAIERFEQSLEVDPEFEAAVFPLAELYFEAGRYSEARPLLESVLAKTGDDSPDDEKALIIYRLGFVAEQEEELDDAQDYYTRALELDPAMSTSLEGLARVYYAKENWEDARTAYEEILEKYSRGRTDEESLELYHRLGNVYLQLGRLDDAAALYGRALRLDRTFRPALRAMVDVSSARGDWEEVINYQEQLVELAEDDGERLGILTAMGDVYRDQLDDPYEAIDTYNQALSLSPDDFEVNNRLYRMFRETGQWQEAARVLERVLEQEQEEARVAVFKQALGEIYLTKVGELEKAVRCFQDILEIDPVKDDAAEAIEDIFTEDENWSGLESHYRKMIKLLPKKERERRIKIWKKLGELYGLRLNNLDGAIMSFEVLTKLDPENNKHLESLAELYSSSEKYRPKAIDTYQHLAKLSAVPVLSFRALRRLYAEAREYDKVFCLCATLRFLKEATTEEETFFRKFLPKAKMKTSKGLNDETFWSHLVHEDARSPASRIFGYLYRYAGPNLAPGTMMTRVKKKDRIDPNDSLLFFCKMLNYVAQVLNMDRPELFRTEIQGRGIAVADSHPPALLLGEDMFKDIPKRDLWYLIARNLIYSRPEFILSRLLPADMLRALLAAVITSFFPKAPADADPREIERWQKRVLRNLPGEVQDYLLELSREYVKEIGEPFDAHKWLEAVDYTANRAGFVVSNDLEVAMQQLVARKDPAMTLPHRALVRDLVHYSVSEDYFTLRERLGFSILT